MLASPSRRVVRLVRAFFALGLLAGPALAVPDLTPPVLTGLRFTPTIIDTRLGPATVTVEVDGTDDMAGITYGYVAFEPVGGGPYRMGSFGSGQLIAGTSLGGTWRTTVTFPQYSTPGTWQVRVLGGAGVVLQDGVGNLDTWVRPELEALGLPTLLEVISTADLAPPELVSLAIAPTTVDTRPAAQVVNVTLHLRDAVSGVRNGYVAFDHESGALPYIIGYFSSGHRVSGSAQDGTWVVPVTFPLGTVMGNWSLRTFTGAGLVAEDQLGNMLVLSGNDVAARGFPTTVTVLGDPPDTEAPRLVDFSFSPDQIDTSTSPQTVTALVTATDNRGIRAGYVAFDPVLPGPAYRVGWFGPADLVSGTLQAGTFRARVVFQQFDQEGCWRVRFASGAGIFLEDQARNALTLSANDLEARGLPTDLHNGPARAARIDVPAPIVLECSAPGGVPATHPAMAAWLASAAAFDECDAVLAVTHDAPGTFLPGCGPAGTTVVTFSSPGSGLSETSTVTIEDTLPPALSGVPADLVVGCDEDLTPASPVATDACDAAPSVTLAEIRTSGPCPATYRLTRTWTAMDACGNTSRATQQVDVVDSEPPALSGVPADLVVGCDEDLTPASPVATDACDAAPSVVLAELRTSGRCPDTYRLTRTWTAMDACGNAASATQQVDVVDSEPPVLVGVPPDATVECDAVPPPASVTAVDGCDGAPVVTFDEQRLPGACPGRYTLHRTWTAVDRCANATSVRQVIEVVDRTPPRVTESRAIVARAWPPNHAMRTIDASVLAPEVADACSEPVSWVIAGCTSSQPEDDDPADPDCVVAPDGGSVTVRAERLGGIKQGRTYELTIIATDACGNASAPTAAGVVHVPHDMRPGGGGR